MPLAVIQRSAEDVHENPFDSYFGILVVGWLRWLLGGLRSENRPPTGAIEAGLSLVVAIGTFRRIRAVTAGKAFLPGFNRLEF